MASHPTWATGPYAPAILKLEELSQVRYDASRELHDKGFEMQEAGERRVAMAFVIAANALKAEK